MDGRSVKFHRNFRGSIKIRDQQIDTRADYRENH